MRLRSRQDFWWIFTTLPLFLFFLSIVAILAQQDKSPETSNLQQGPSTLKINVALVVANVTVADREDHFVLGLEKNHFQIYEDNVEQTIEEFGREDIPVSIGILFDVSGSMSNGILESRRVTTALLETSNKMDEFSLLTFAAAPKTKEDFTSDVSTIQNRVIYEQVKGCTSLLDAVYLGLAKMRKAHNPKRALILISDGGENCSRYSFSQVKNALQEADVQVFGIGAGSREGFGLMEVIAETTGGHAYHTGFLEDTCTKISLELRNQYVLGYYSTNLRRDGLWRKIKVKVNPPPGMPPLMVRTRRGYFAPSN
jgi:Ca-activated chloride channel family protein